MPAPLFLLYSVPDYPQVVTMPMPPVHVAVSTPLAAAIWLFTGSLPAAVLSWCAGVLVDADHLVDSWLNLRRLEWNPRALVDAIKDSGKLYLPLHAIEWLALLVVITVVFPGPLSTGLAVGYCVHLALDVVLNGVPVRLYILAFRAVHGFSCSWTK